MTGNLKEIQKNKTRRLDRRKIAAIGITCLTAWLFAYLAFEIFTEYAFALFLWLPLVMGIMSTIIYGFHNGVSNKELRRTAFISLFVFMCGLLLFAMEGLICIIMVAPFAAAIVYTGYHIGRLMLRRNERNSMLVTIILVISVPLVMAFENTIEPDDDMRSVVTSIEINAAPEEVWQNVIRFPRLKEPDEWIFKTGIAYPVNATINGNGAGAIRYCNFSTGSFVEPVTVWNEPELLRFSVTQQPEPMKEMSPFDIHPAHLDGFWVSKQGQFRLIRLKNGNTLLEGTTWYVNRIRPGIYWTLWSDFIVHRIHQRVLKHIREQSERHKAGTAISP